MTRHLRKEGGQITAFVVVITAAVLMFAALVLDGGLALGAKVRAIGEAQEAARAGAQAVDLEAYRSDGTLRLEPARARALAQRHLASTQDTGAIRLDGDTVIVTVTATQHTQLLKLFGLGSLTVSGQGSAHPQLGVRNPEP